MNKQELLKRIGTEFIHFLNIMDPDNYATLGPYGQAQMKRTIPRTTYYKKLYRFEKYGLLKRREKGGRVNFVITAKAKYLRRKPAVKKSRSDGFSTLIIFDIPQEKRNARDALRRYLIRNGYTQIRESCFLSPFVVTSDLIDFCHELKLEKNITMFTAKVDYLLDNNS